MLKKIEQFQREAVEKLGGIVVEDPLTEGSDMFGFLVFKK